MTRLSGWRRERVRGLLARAQHTGPLREDALSAMACTCPRPGGSSANSAVAWPPPARLPTNWTCAGLPGRAARCRIRARRRGRSSDHTERSPTVGRSLAARHSPGRPQYLPKNPAWTRSPGCYRPGRQAEGQRADRDGGQRRNRHGVARVLAGPADFAAFSAGEILVAPITTPAFTPFVRDGRRVVTDIGGVLSHGSIVARGVRNPSVLGVGGRHPEDPDRRPDHRRRGRGHRPAQSWTGSEDAPVATPVQPAHTQRGADRRGAVSRSPAPRFSGTACGAAELRADSIFCGLRTRTSFTV